MNPLDSKRDRTNDVKREGVFELEELEVALCVRGGPRCRMITVRRIGIRRTYDAL